MIISQRGKCVQTDLFRSRKTIMTRFNTAFNITAIKRPKTSTVEVVTPCFRDGYIRISQVRAKHILQIKATREKNIKFRI